VRSDRERLLDILEAIEKIEERVPAGAAEAFARDEMLQVWVLHHVQLIGEAASRLSDEARGKCSDVPWADVIGMRNILVHQYFSTDLDQVWYSVEYELPRMKKRVQQMLLDAAD
jgi:uncharacterized protein with HEPN domain